MKRFTGTGLAIAAAAVLAAGSAAAAASSTGLSAGQASPAHGAGSAAAAGTGSTAVADLGAGGWKVLSSATATQTGQQISTPGFSTSGWLSVTNDDADAPGTEVEALVQSGSCPNVFFSTNMKTCFGTMKSIGRDSIKQFSVPWWFRTDFTPGLHAGQDAKLIVNGVVGMADVWVNSHEVATSATVTGAYTRFTFDVTNLLV